VRGHEPRPGANVDPRAITAVILTRDEERNLPRALTSLPRGVQVLVLDAQSDDGTVAYARNAGARVIERPWKDFVDARRFALSQVETEWLLMLDADEALDDVLCQALLAADANVDGYVVRRTTSFAGKPMRMWSDEPLLRLVRTSRARVAAQPVTGGDALVHERLLCDGPIAELCGTLLHYSYPDAGTYREKFERYTTLEASGKPRDFGRAMLETLAVPLRFARNAFRRGAVLDGPRGWYVAWFSALYPAVVAWKCRG
jgi:glycosyltransferase involved in cell wall biosynthesis